MDPILPPLAVGATAAAAASAVMLSRLTLFAFGIDARRASSILAIAVEEPRLIIAPGDSGSPITVCKYNACQQTQQRKHRIACFTSLGVFLASHTVRHPPDVDTASYRTHIYVQRYS